MAGFPIEVATRIKTLPPYLFADIDKMKQAAIARGVDIINLGIGDPDLPTPAPIIDSLAQAATHGYQRALLVGACIVLAASVVALLTPNTHETTVVKENPEDAALELAA